MEQDRVQDFSKPWITTWLAKLRGLPSYDLAVGVWLAAQADERGVVEGVDWSRLTEESGVSLTRARQALRDGALIERKLVRAKQRVVGEQQNVWLPTIYHLNIK